LRGLGYDDAAGISTGNRTIPKSKKRHIWIIMVLLAPLLTLAICWLGYKGWIYLKLYTPFKVMRFNENFDNTMKIEDALCWEDEKYFCLYSNSHDNSLIAIAEGVSYSGGRSLRCTTGWKKGRIETGEIHIKTPGIYWVIIDFKILIKDKIVSENKMEFDGLGPSVAIEFDKFDSPYSLLSFLENGSIEIRDDCTPLKLKRGHWYHARIRVEIDKNREQLTTYVSLDGRIFKKKQQYPRSWHSGEAPLHAESNHFISFSAGGGTCYLDDIKIFAPRE